jgi:acyl-CoA thioesterase FadM
MNLLGRLLLVVLRALRYRRGACAPLDAARLRFHVLPHDLDFNLHVNNARYLALMDLGRVDLLNHLGLMRLAFRGRWFPVLGQVSIRYHRPLLLFQGFDLVTRIVGWDAKWFYLEQRFEREGKPIATAYARALVRGPDGSIPTDRIIAALGFQISSPELPAEVRRMQEPGGDQ